MTPTPRFKNNGTEIIARNDTDTADIRLKVLELHVTAGDVANSNILTSDAFGVGVWRVNPAIQSAADAQTAADNAQAAADTAQTAADNAATAAGNAQTTANNAASAASAAQSTANTAVTNAGAAQATANGAVSAAAAADAAAGAAGVAAAAAGTAAAAAGTAAAAAGVTAIAAGAAAASAAVVATSAQTTADNAFPSRIALFGDELVYTTGTPTRTISNTFPYNWITFTTTNLAAAHALIDMKRGKWTFCFLTILRNDCGRVAISIEGAPIVDPEELYQSTANLQKIFTYPNVTVEASGVHTLQFAVTGKHASSTGYVLVPIKFWGYRTGD